MFGFENLTANAALRKSLAVVRLNLCKICRVTGCVAKAKKRLGEIRSNICPNWSKELYEHIDGMKKKSVKGSNDKDCHKTRSTSDNSACAECKIEGGVVEFTAHYEPWNC